MKYEVVIGLEVHVELATESKLFCSCGAKFGADPNENVCPACAGMPGMLPVANKKAVELGIAAALVTNSRVTPVITFDKKNYFYPDLPTGYQNTQWLAPICRDGYVDIETQAGQKRINLKQIHIEEDAGKLVHSHGVSLADYNRGGVPLVEIVSQPDFRSAEEVIVYLEKLRTLLSFAGVSDCRMQEGSMRCDVNLSVREAGSDILGTRTEMKNMNSLKAIVRAIAFETERHINALETGSEELVQETRRWDDSIGESFAMREKENATDYRYFPNPEIMPIQISEQWIDAVRASLPETAHDKFSRMTKELSVSESDAKIITGSKNLADIFDALTKNGVLAKDAASWIVTELLSMETQENKSSDDIKINTDKFAALILLVNKKEISRTVAKKVFALLYAEDVDPIDYVKQNNLGMVSDAALLDGIVASVLAENPDSVGQYRGGNEKVVGFLMGKIMGKTAGKADPGVVREMLMNGLAAASE
ncbi:MAG: Asp-tRNA(Asn)/Glu-tRNA(Gln) amidotransferase subunit GatB [Oscillospiraceae bacterium]|nr:Asp-tRNA(Asn)/Glu-tRNA(Gln) amidotransferase subunit GatB [Oscillospiraceae bacterium]